MAYADKQKMIQYNREYSENNYDRISVTVPKGEKEKIQEFARAHCETVNGMINRLIAQEMGQGSSGKR